MFQYSSQSLNNLFLFTPIQMKIAVSWSTEVPIKKSNWIKTKVTMVVVLYKPYSYCTYIIVNCAWQTKSQNLYIMFTYLNPYISWSFVPNIHQWNTHVVHIMMTIDLDLEGIFLMDFDDQSTKEPLHRKILVKIFLLIYSQSIL